MIKQKKNIIIKNMTQLMKYREYLLKHHRLTYLFIELTNACNLNCMHCGSNCNPKNYEYIGTELIIDSLRQLSLDYNPKTIMICLTGGEPLFYPDFYKIAEEIMDVQQ